MSMADISGEAERPSVTLSGRIRRRIERLGPYQSLALLAVPMCTVTPDLVAGQLPGHLLDLLDQSSFVTEGSGHPFCG